MFSQYIIVKCKKEAKAVEEVGSGLEESKVVEEAKAVEEVAHGLKKVVWGSKIRESMIDTLLPMIEERRTHFLPMKE